MEKRPSSSAGVLGSGLAWPSFGLLLALSVSLFIFWGGALWQARPHDSHLWRFVVSYGVVVPLAALLLVLASTLSCAHLATTVGTTWAIKLALTIPLYFAFAAGGGMFRWADVPGPSPVRPATRTAASGYRAADARFSAGTVLGELAGGPAVVFLDAPAPGLPLAEGREVTLRLSGGRYDKPLYAATTADTLRVDNGDDTLHTLRLTGSGVAGLNLPVPGHGHSSAAELSLPGVFEVRCDNHPNDRGERAVVVVLDHPYFAEVGAGGAFRFEQVPAGGVTLVVLAAGSRAPRDRRRIVVTEGGTTRVRPSADASTEEQKQ